MRRRLSALVFVSGALAACATPVPDPGPSASPAIAVRRPPNVIVILADDLGYGDVGVYGQTKIRTPRLDRMAAQGIRFTHFYAGSTVCAPSRAALMTGQHTGHNPIRGNRERPEGQEPLPPAATTLAEVMRQAGYATGHAGKWGLGGLGSGSEPWNQGFDEFFGYLDQRHAHFSYTPFLYRNDQRVAIPGNEVAGGGRIPGAGHAVRRGRHSHDVIADEALDFIRRHRDRPFFLYAGFTPPHPEILAPDDAMAPYLDAQGKSIFPETPFAGNHYSPQPMPRAAYAAIVTRLDRDVGRILDTLQALGIADNTIVLFTSDNGPAVEGGSDPEFFDSNGPFRGVKRDLYEGGIRVPMIAWGPGRVASGQVSAHPWTLWDFLPTIAALTGGRTPSGIDGLSMAPLITGEGVAPTHAHLYWEFHERRPAQAVRAGRWKGVRTPIGTGALELYDLETDPGERTDVAAAHPAEAARLGAILEQARTPSPIWDR